MRRRVWRGGILVAVTCGSRTRKDAHRAFPGEKFKLAPLSLNMQVLAEPHRSASNVAAQSANHKQRPARVVCLRNAHARARLRARLPAVVRLRALLGPVPSLDVPCETVSSAQSCQRSTTRILISSYEVLQLPTETQLALGQWVLRRGGCSCPSATAAANKRYRVG